MRLLLLAFLQIFLLSFPAAAGKTKVIYYEKSADSVDVVQTLQANDKLKVISQKSPSTYYDDRLLGSNALMCGEGTDEKLVKQVFDDLMSLGVEIRYFGKYYREEKNAKQKAIDIRSINGPSYYENFRPLTANDLPKVGDDFCGVGNGLEIAARSDGMRRRVEIFPGLSKSFATSLADQVQKSDKVKVEFQKLTDGKYNLKIIYLE